MDLTTYLDERPNLGQRWAQFNQSKLGTVLNEDVKGVIELSLVGSIAEVLRLYQIANYINVWVNDEIIKYSNSDSYDAYVGLTSRVEKEFPSLAADSEQWHRLMILVLSFHHYPGQFYLVRLLVKSVEAKDEIALELFRDPSVRMNLFVETNSYIDFMWDQYISDFVEKLQVEQYGQYISKDGHLNLDNIHSSLEKEVGGFPEDDWNQINQYER